jgi:hypothetical protein
MAWTGTRWPPGSVTVAFAGRPEVGDPAALAEAPLDEPGAIELEHGDRHRSRLTRPVTAHSQQHVRSTRRDPGRDHPAGERVEKAKKPPGHPIPDIEPGGREIIGCHDWYLVERIASVVVT